MPLSTPRRSVYESKWQSRLGSDCGSRSSIVDGRGLRAAGRHFHFLRLDERQQPSIGSNDVRLLTAIKDNVSVLLAHPLPNTGNASHGAGHEDYRRSTIWNGEIVSVSSSRVSDARDSGNKDNRKYGRDDVFSPEGDLRVGFAGALPFRLAPRTQMADEVRIDYVGHALSALVGCQKGQ